MRSYKAISNAFLLGLMLLSSCGKEDKSDQSAESEFSWTYNGTTYIAKQHAAYATGIGTPSIIAGLQSTLLTPGSGPRINLTSLQQGIYSITSGGANRFEYIDEVGDIHAGNAGSINITRNASSLLNGNFSVTLTNNRIITGNFINTTVKP